MMVILEKSQKQKNEYETKMKYFENQTQGLRSQLRTQYLLGLVLLILIF